MFLPLTFRCPGGGRGGLDVRAEYVGGNRRPGGLVHGERFGPVFVTMKIYVPWYIDEGAKPLECRRCGSLSSLPSADFAGSGGV